MSRITIDGLTYSGEHLSESGRAQLASLQFLETQMLQLRNEMAVYETAHQAYVVALKAEIAATGVQPVDADERPN